MKLIPLNDRDGKVITARKGKDKILPLSGAFHERILLMLMRPCNIIVILNFLWRMDSGFPELCGRKSECWGQKWSLGSSLAAQTCGLLNQPLNHHDLREGKEQLPEAPWQCCAFQPPLCSEDWAKGVGKRPWLLNLTPINLLKGLSSPFCFRVSAAPSVIRSRQHHAGEWPALTLGITSSHQN